MLYLPDLWVVCDCVPTDSFFLFCYKEQVRSDGENALKCFRFKLSIPASVYLELSINVIIEGTNIFREHPFV